MHAKDTRLVGSRGYDSATAARLRVGTDDDRASAELWVVELLHGCIEGIHVDVHDPPGSRHIRLRALAVWGETQMKMEGAGSPKKLMYWMSWLRWCSSCST